MAEYFKGTVVPSPIVKSASGNTYGTHHSILGVGGYMEVNTIVERNALPLDDVYGTIYFDGTSSGQRRLGMLVHVFEDDIIYHLHPKDGNNYLSYSGWTAYTDTQKYIALGDNNNWYPLFDTATGISGDKIGNIYTQTTHSFVVGDVIGYNGVNFTKVDSATASTVEPLGVVTVSDFNGTGGTNASFTLTYAGYVSTIGMVDFTGGTLSNGTVYYLANSGYTGTLTEFPPTGVAEVSKPMLVKISGDTAIVLQYRGTSKADEGVTLGDFYTYTGDTQTFLDTTVTGATNIGYFSGMTGIQTLSILTSDSDYNGNYTVEYNNYYRDTNGIVRIGSPTHNGILRRGYVSNFTPTKSWLYNTHTGGTNQIGWALVDGDITENVGNYVISNSSAGTPPFTETEWWYTGGTLNDGYYSNSAISLNVNGDVYTGNTYNLGGPVFRDKVYQELRLRTLMTDSPNTLEIRYDDNFVYLSGSTGDLTGVVSGTSLGTGIPVVGTVVNNALQFKSFISSGGTTLVDTGNEIRITSPNTVNNVYTSSIVTSNITLTTGSSFVILVSHSGLININLPATPINGQAFRFKDVTGNGLTYNITVSGNGKNIDGLGTALINTNYGSFELLFNATLDAWYSLSFVN